MTFTDWLTLAGFCLLGAASPGPSLAVILRHTLTGSRRNGIAAALTHGAGVGIYALAVVLGLNQLIASYPAIYTFISYAGAAYLVWLAVKMLNAKNSSQPNEQAAPPSVTIALRDGFMIVFLNPQVILLLAALFSQFIQPGQSLQIGLLLAATAWIIDTCWYLAVAIGLSHSKILPWLQTHALWINRISALFLVLIALRVVTL